MKRSIPMFLAILIILVQNCSSTLDIDYDPKIDFSQYKVFTWMTKPGSIEKPGFYDLIKAEIEEGLTLKGFERDKGSPDFGIIISTGAYGQISETEYGFGHVKEAEAASEGDRYFSEGTLVLDIIDIKTKRQAWRGSVSIINRDPNNPQKAITQAVHKVLARFPPE